MVYKFSEHCLCIINKNKVILGNRNTGEWIRTSKEVYEILNLGMDNKLSIAELKLKLYDDEDRSYIDSLYNKLSCIGILEIDGKKEEIKPRMITFDITSRCNLKCTHCCASADIMNKDTLSNSDVKAIIDKIVICKPESIVLTGGEPMLRDDFLDILEYTKKNYHGKIIVATNGTLINNDNIDKLIECSSQLDISLDGVDEETCSVIRGKGVFSKVIDNIKLLHSKDFNEITVSMTMSEKTENLEKKFYELNKILGTQAYTRRFTPIGRGLSNKHLFLSDENNELYIPNYIKEDTNQIIPICSCRAGKYELFISNKGDLYPCSSFINDRDKLGNMADILNIEDTINNKSFYNNLLNDLENNTYNYCRDCKVNLFCWTCRGKLKELKGNEEAFKKRCTIMKVKLYKRIWDEDIELEGDEIYEL